MTPAASPAPRKVLVAMSGGVDSSVAAALLVDAGHDVVGVTLRLWGGESDTGCCSVSDVDDARRVAQQLGIDHLVFNFSDDFDHHVVAPYVGAHVAGVTPNPCIECNRHLKFDRLSERAALLGFDAVATGHHARVAMAPDGRRRVFRGADADKDQSYVVHMVAGQALDSTLFPVGSMTKDEVRRIARERGLRTASKPDSQDVCFISRTAGGRESFLRRRIPVRAGEVVDTSGVRVGEVDAVELVTIGQRRGLGLPGGGPVRFVVDVDVDNRRVSVGSEQDLQRTHEVAADVVWSRDAQWGPALVQASAHGAARPAVLSPGSAHGRVVVDWESPQRRVAPGQSLVFYDPSDSFVLGGGTAT